MAKIAISYRRADSEAMTGRIFDRLSSYYGKDAIFRDIDSIPPGIDFRVHINETLRKTSILLAIVGPEWLGMSSGGLERIQEESDAVRVEVETALRRRLPIIPILIGSTKMPGSDLLPPSLKDFAFRNAVRVDTGQDFDYHMDRLIRSMDAILSQAPKSPPSGETKIPSPKSSDTGSRQAVAADASRKRDTGSRAAVVTAPDRIRGERKPLFTLSMPAVSRDTMWPADQQGRMLRMAIAGGAALAVLLVLFGVFFLRGGGGQERRLYSLTGHTGPVSAVAFSPNGKLVASGSLDKSVRIWDVAGGLLQQTLSGDTEVIYAVAFEINGKRLVSGGKDGVIAIRDIDNGQRVVRPLRPEMTYGWDVMPAVLSLAISPDGVRLASGSADATIKIWNANTGVLLRVLNGHTDAVRSVVYTPDGKTIVSGSADGTVRTWDAESGQQLRTLNGHAGPVLAVAVSPDGKRIAAAGSGDAVVLWSAGNLQQQRTLATQLSTVNTLAFTHDGSRLAVGGSDSAIQMWDADAGQLLHSLTGHSASVRALAFTAAGSRLASGSDDRTVGIWSAN